MATAYTCTNGAPASGSSAGTSDVERCAACDNGNQPTAQGTCVDIPIPATDFDTLAAAGNNDPEGIWSNGTTMWVVDDLDDKLYAYTMSTKARDSSKNFNTLSIVGNNEPRGVWSDGATMWVTDSEDDKIYAYKMSDTSRILDPTGNSNDDGLRCGNFGITDNVYEDTSDWDQTVEDIFGTGYRVADWNDLVAFHNGGGDLLALFDGLGLTEQHASVSVKRSGDPNYSSSRYYFATRHEHNKPGSYLAHENIDNYLISLGSWWGSRRILSVKV